MILNSTSAANAYGDTASLFDYGFGNFEKTDMKVSMEPIPFKVLPCDKYILKNNGNTYPFYYKTKVYVTLPKGIDKSQLTKRQAVLQNAAGPLRLKSKYYYKNKWLAGECNTNGMSYQIFLSRLLEIFLRRRDSCFSRISSAASVSSAFRVFTPKYFPSSVFRILIFPATGPCSWQRARL